MLDKMQIVLKQGLYKMGLDVQRLSPGKNPSLQILKALNFFGVDLVFDIGANVGQFASSLRAVGYRGRIISFEPLTDAHRILAARVARDSSWILHQRGAIGDFDGEIEINIAGNSLSSSVLPMLNAHATAAFDSAYIGKEKVPICRLDSVASAYIPNSCRYFIKVDTQGFEWQVLDGGNKTLEQAQGVMCELSFVPLYKGQRLWLDLLHRLEGAGFTLWSIQPGFVDPRDGRTLQMDAIFFRTEVDVVAEN